MRTDLMIKRLVGLSFAISILTWATPPTHAADPLVEGAMVLAPAGALSAVASGVVEDTLEICMARIPEDASVGQRMLAERGCTSAEEVRRSMPNAIQF